MAFPNGMHTPSGLGESVLLHKVARSIPLNFRGPICGVGLRQTRAARAVVTMPKTAMHKDDLPPCRKNEVRTAGQIFSVKAEPIAEAVQKTSDGKLWLGVSS